MFPDDPEYKGRAYGLNESPSEKEGKFLMGVSGLFIKSEPQ